MLLRIREKKEQGKTSLVVLPIFYILVNKTKQKDPSRLVVAHVRF
jgi:hypothetical protein